jgi:predicted dehydrogenase
MKKLSWGLIGCGDISRKRVAPALRDAPSSELTAVCRARAELAEPFAREFGARKHYAQWRDMLADPEIDAVYVATPLDVHAEQTIAAAKAGKHVLCEKPMAMTVAECDRVIAACASAQVKLGIAYYRRFYPVLDRIKSILASVEIGRPTVAQINAFEWFNPKPGEPRYWFMQRQHSGGGPMMDFGCHRIEVLLNLLGPIRHTQAFTDNVLFDREVEDTSGAFFRFESGARATLVVTHAAFESQDTLDIFASEGSIHVPVLNEGKMTVKTCDGERQEADPPHRNFHQPLVEDFVSAVLEDRAPAVGGDMGREVQRIEEIIYSG